MPSQAFGRRPLKTIDESKWSPTTAEIIEWWDYLDPGALRAIVREVKLSNSNAKRWNARDWERVIDYYVRVEQGDPRGFTRGRNV